MTVRQLDLYEHNTKMWACIELGPRRHVAIWGPKTNGCFDAVTVSEIQGSGANKQREKIKKGYSFREAVPLTETALNRLHPSLYAKIAAIPGVIEGGAQPDTTQRSPKPANVTDYSKEVAWLLGNDS